MEIDRGNGKRKGEEEGLTERGDPQMPGFKTQKPQAQAPSLKPKASTEASTPKPQP
jgi:hypothetical protein